MKARGREGSEGSAWFREGSAGQPDAPEGDSATTEPWNLVSDLSPDARVRAHAHRARITRNDGFEGSEGSVAPGAPPGRLVEGTEPSRPRRFRPPVTLAVLRARALASFAAAAAVPVALTPREAFWLADGCLHTLTVFAYCEDVGVYRLTRNELPPRRHRAAVQRTLGRAALALPLAQRRGEWTVAADELEPVARWLALALGTSEPLSPPPVAVEADPRWPAWSCVREPRATPYAWSARAWAAHRRASV